MAVGDYHDTAAYCESLILPFAGLVHHSRVDAGYPGSSNQHLTRLLTHRIFQENEEKQPTTKVKITLRLIPSEAYSKQDNACVRIQPNTRLRTAYTKGQATGSRGAKLSSPDVLALRANIASLSDQGSRVRLLLTN
jgi:hypothetical protein